MARRIQAIDGNLTYNKNQRILLTTILSKTHVEDRFSEVNIELMVFERVSIPMEDMVGLKPNQNRVLENRQLKSYVAWLICRYSRPSLPTTFNKRIRVAAPKNYLRDVTKKANDQLTGIYVEIMPDAEINEDQNYRDNLLGLLPAGFKGNFRKAEGAINAYAKVFHKAGVGLSLLAKWKMRFLLLQ